MTSTTTETSFILNYFPSTGGVAKWLGSGLQNRVRGFNSLRHLQMISSFGFGSSALVSFSVSLHLNLGLQPKKDLMKNKLFYRKTKRLIIRPLQTSDYNVWKLAYTSMLAPKNKFDTSLNRKKTDLTKKMFAKMLTDQNSKRQREEYCDYGVFLKSSGELIGRVGLGHFIRSVTQSSFMGYVLFNRYWGFGYAEEAVTELIDIAFHDHRLHRVVAGIEPDNKKSIRLAKKLGFRKEGLSKRVVLLRGEWQDLVQYALTTEDKKMNWTGQIEVRKR